MSSNNTESFINGSYTFSIHIVPFGAVVFFGGLVATLGNALILLGFFKVGEFRKHKCNVLIANLALADLLSSLHFVVVGCLTLLGSLVDNGYLIMTNERCFYICAWAVLSFNAGSFMIFAVGVDRMLATTLPVRYNNLPKMPYTLTLNLASWLFGCLNFVFAFLCKDQNTLVPACILPTALAGFAHDFWNKCNLAFVLLVLITYAIAYRQLGRPRTAWGRSDSGQQQQQQHHHHVGHRQHRRLLNSLILVVLVYVSSWAVTMLVIFVVTALQARFSVVFHASMYVGILANVNVGCNFYIYYLRSDDYRKEIRKALVRWKNSGKSLRENIRLLTS